LDTISSELGFLFSNVDLVVMVTIGFALVLALVIFSLGSVVVVFVK